MSLPVVPLNTLAASLARCSMRPIRGVDKEIIGPAEARSDKRVVRKVEKMKGKRGPSPMLIP
jgi:hypothetical protein